MSLTIRVLGTPDVGPVGSFTFYAGEERTLKLQLMDSDSGSSHPIPSAATKALVLHGTPDDVDVADGDIDVDSDDASIFSVDLDEATTALLISGDIEFTYVDSGVTRIATGEGLLKKVLTSFS